MEFPEKQDDVTESVELVDKQLVTQSVSPVAKVNAVAPDVRVENTSEKKRFSHSVRSPTAKNPALANEIKSSNFANGGKSSVT